MERNLKFTIEKKKNTYTFNWAVILQQNLKLRSTVYTNHTKPWVTLQRSFLTVSKTSERYG